MSEQQGTHYGIYIDGKLLTEGPVIGGADFDENRDEVRVTSLRPCRQTGTFEASFQMVAKASDTRGFLRLMRGVDYESGAGRDAQSRRGDVHPKLVHLMGLRDALYDQLHLRAKFTLKDGSTRFGTARIVGPGSRRARRRLELAYMRTDRKIKRILAAEAKVFAESRRRR